MSRLKRATLTDVARLAGVSVTTASYILNGRTEQMRISGETALKVKAAMLELDYRPNWSARTLRRAKTQTIGVISDFLAGGAFAGQLIIGANAEARKRDHLLVISETLGDHEVELLMIEEMLARQVDGIIYATLTASAVELPERLRTGPTVLLNCTAEGVDVPAVVPDDVQGGRLAAQSLLAADVRGEVYVVGEDPTIGATAGPERLEGIRSTLAAAGRPLAGVVSCQWGVVPARQAVDAWLADHRPGALICLNDRIAFGVYQALDDHGLTVPDDVAVISFDGSDIASWLRPRLTTLRLPLVSMGARAVSVLLEPSWRAAGIMRVPLEVDRGASMP